MCVHIWTILRYLTTALYECAITLQLWLFLQVYTFGCNDEGSLGRPTKEEEECMEPGKVDLPEKIVLVSAGDSHTAALSEFGQVYIWGTFRVSILR